MKHLISLVLFLTGMFCVSSMGQGPASGTGDTPAIGAQKGTSVAPAPVKKQNVAVLDLERRGGISPNEIMTISDRLRGELLKTGKYVIVERGEMDDVLEEQRFQATEACSKAECLVQAGQLLAVHKMVGGSIGKVGRVFSINIKIIDVETGKIDRTIDRAFKTTKEKLLSEHMREIARAIGGLKSDGSVFTKWYVWGGAGAVAAAGAGAFLLLSGSDDGGSPGGGDTGPVETGDVKIEWH